MITLRKFHIIMFPIALLLSIAIWWDKGNYWLIVVWLIVYITIFIIGIFHIRWGFFLPVLSRANVNSSNQIAITFDDGPTLYTQQILDVLDRYQVKATFFCIGASLERYQEIGSEIVDRGHIIGNHTFSHQRDFPFKGKQSIINELERTNETIEKVTDKHTLLFRPPYGVTNPRIARALKYTNHKVIGWNIRSLDTVIKNEDRIFQRIISRIKPGAIILLHDTSEITVNVLVRILDYTKLNQIEIVPLDQLLKIKVYEN